jgi:hypothetical protein
MSDNKKYAGKKDRIRVDSKDSSEVEYLHGRFPDLSQQAISGAVRAAGPMRKDIVNYLNKKNK